MKKHNIFITFEGGEGTGKTTTAQLVKSKLETKGVEVFLTREPGGQGLALAEDIREIIMKHGDIDPITELLLFNASRREHVSKKIAPNLEKGKLVISDRFIDSTIVYQGIARGIDKNTILEANKIAIQETIPNLVFIFDLDPEIGIKRIIDNEVEINRFDNEGLEFHKKIRKGYKDLLKIDPKKYLLIDSTKSVDEISDYIIDKIEHYGDNIS